MELAGSILGANIAALGGLGILDVMTHHTQASPWLFIFMMVVGLTLFTAIELGGNN